MTGHSEHRASNEKLKKRQSLSASGRLKYKLSLKEDCEVLTWQIIREKMLKDFAIHWSRR